jgi:dTDP-4-dehydrorhamnose 3,5-epimerase
MDFLETGFEGLYLIKVNQLRDERGVFARTFCKEEFKKIGFTKDFVQMNFSFNPKRGTFRGFHLQLAPHQETKLIRCSEGKVVDIAIDLRPDSKTFLKSYSCELSKENRDMILIPEGFAHGFITLEDNSELAYCHTAYYNPKFESGVCYNDKALNVSLPIEIQIISDKDLSYPSLNPNN